jgi:hypothetical protein
MPLILSVLLFYLGATNGAVLYIYSTKRNVYIQRSCLTFYFILSNEQRNLKRPIHSQLN